MHPKSSNAFRTSAQRRHEAVKVLELWGIGVGHHPSGRGPLQGQDDDSDPSPFGGDVSPVFLHVGEDVGEKESE